MLRTTLLLLIATAMMAADKKPVTLAVVAQPPSTRDSVGQVVWKPDGRSFAWLSGKTIWLYDIAERKRRELGSIAPLETTVGAPATSNQPFAWENRRVSEQRLQWTPDSRSLLLLVSGDLFLWEVSSGKWQRLTETAEAERDPKLSPDGTMISFQRSNELHVMELATRKVRQLTSDSTSTVWNGRLDWVYPEELDLGTAHWWSPDSKRIAFLQFDVTHEWLYPQSDLLTNEARYEPQRYPKAGTPNPDVRLGVVSPAGGKVLWVDCGDTRDTLLARVTWLPDSTRIAVQKMNRVQNVLTLLFADAASGAVKPILTERDPYWVNVTNDLRFLTTRDAFVWTSEASGYRHLYLYSNDGKRQKRLTNGTWEVHGVVGLDRDEKTLYYTSRERNPLGVDLAAVDLNGGNKRLVTQARGVHSISMSPGADHFIDTYSSLTEPPRKILRKSTGDEVAVLQPPGAALDEYVYLKPEVLEVKAGDGTLLYARLLKPAGFTPSKKYPAIVSIYGGPHSQSVCDCFGGLSWEQAMAQRGYVMWALDNRGTSGRGHAFEAKLFRRFGKQELEDQQAGIRHLLRLGFVDPARIGMTGWSYGGFMTLYTLLNDPGLVRAGFAGAPVTDWRFYDTIYTERYLGLPQENQEGYQLSSPLHQARQLESALMIAHNYTDDNVLFQNSFQMMVELQKAGKQFEIMLYPQKSHGVSGSARKHLVETQTSFFDRHLMPQ